MITDAIVSAFLAAVAALFSLLPSITLPDITPDMQLFQYARAFGNIVPLNDLFICVGISIGLHLLFNAWDLALFVYHQFWGSN